MQTLPSILKIYGSELALVIGNGVNRYSEGGRSSWQNILNQLASPALGAGSSIPHGISFTEFFDTLELRDNKTQAELQKQVCELLLRWKPSGQHSRIASWAQRNDAPIVTTNFDNLLALASSSTIHTLKSEGFTAHYPWSHYFSPEEIDSPLSGFGIWHINGTIKYHQSIRLGLTHYMGSVQRARSWIHGASEEGLFSTKDRKSWVGASTWLHIIFNRPLLFFGLELNENEVFLRWLLIERAKYFKKFPLRQKPAWFLYAPSQGDTFAPGKRYFLERVGFQIVCAESYMDMYESGAWSDF